MAADSAENAQDETAPPAPALATTDSEAPPEEPTEESRAQATNRWIREGRRWDVDRFRRDRIKEGVDSGMTRAQAGDWAWKVAMEMFPPNAEQDGPPPKPPVSDEGEGSTDEGDVTPVESEPDPPQPVPDEALARDGRLAGLGDIPADWPELPANANLSAEIQWVQSVRLDVVEETPSGGTRVHLDRAASPAPSRAALAWLETSIRTYAKYVDVVARATSQQQDDQETVRRERYEVARIRSLLESQTG